MKRTSFCASAAVKVIAIVLASGSTAALAQTAELPQTDDGATQQAVQSGPQFNTIVVTAQKRAEDVQDIPIAISALGEDQLQQSGFDGVSDLSFMVPSLQFGNFGAISYLSLRGIGSADNFAGSDPGVALHIDGVYIGRPVGALFAAFDTERVEVLRGPQGTLYGRNATGGSVNLITKKPDDDLGGEVEVTLGNYDLTRVRGALNIPINDAIRLRVVGFKEDRDGFTKNTFPNRKNANDLNNWGLRGHLEIDLSDNFNLLLSAAHVHVGGVGSQAEQRDPMSTGELNPPFNSLVAGGIIPELAPGIPDNVAFYTNADGSIPVNDLRPFVESKDFQESVDNKFTLLSATMAWDLDAVTVKSITGYGKTRFNSIFDSDATSAPNAIHILFEKAEQFSQELQVVSNGSGPLRWITGLYYFHEDATRTSTQIGARFEAIHDLFIANDFSLGGPGFDEDVVFQVGGDIKTESYAAFGQATYELTDDLSLTVGLRYTDDQKDAVNRNIQFAPLVLTPVSVSSGEVTGKASLDYRFTDKIMGYASYSRGYKSGGVVQVATDPTAAAFLPEFVNTYELGIKSQLWHALQLNGAVYYSDYTDLQTSAEGAFGQLGGNAGKATIKGAELEWNWLINNNLTFDGSVAYLDAKYDTLLAFDPLDQMLLGGVVDYSGNRLPRSPEFTYNMGLTGSWDLPGDKGTINARVEGSYTDEMFSEFTNRPESRLDEYYNLNARLWWTNSDENLTIELYGTNLTNEIQEGNLLLGFALNVSTQPNGYAEVGQEFVTYNPPRQYGVRARFKF